MDDVTNFAYGTLSTTYNDTDTSLVLNTGQGASFPDTSGTDFNIVVWNVTDYANPALDPDVEIMRVTDRTSDTLTVTRAQEGTAASVKNVSGKTYAVIQSFTQKLYDDIVTAVLARAVKAQTTGFSVLFSGETVDGDYVIYMKLPFAVTITETTTKCASGTATATFKINTTALGGTANSVSSSEQSQAHASSNSASAGDDLVVTISSASALTDMRVSLTMTRTLD